MTKFVSTKTYKDLGPVAYRQWRDEGNCHFLHGYALSFHFEFECDTLDYRNWCVDFGGLRPLKDKLEDWFDHKLLVAEDDPNLKDIMKLHDLGIAVVHVMPKLGCESLADQLYEYVNEIFLPDNGWGDRVWCCKVEVREKEANSAMRVGHRGA
jgi:6-pyruvoyltetrahydropterin/6-carboxytetrahydropterin synthase